MAMKPRNLFCNCIENLSDDGTFYLGKQCNMSVYRRSAAVSGYVYMAHRGCKCLLAQEMNDGVMR